MIFRVRSLIAAMVCCACLSTVAAAQDDVIARARAEASAGRRPAAIELLAKHLSDNPRDVDARLVYGLILSWEGRYDDARRELSQVLAQAPNYMDARVALMNVEWWSGKAGAARDQVRLILEKDPGNTQARLVKQRLDASTRPWSVGFGATTDSFNQERETWREGSITVGRITKVGSLIARGSGANRFGLTDRQYDVEFYPTFRAGSYAFVGYGWSEDEVLYPQHHVAFDFYQSLGHGYEVSAGYRQLAFSAKTDIYVGTLTKYSGSWMLTAKALTVPDQAVGNSWTYSGLVRRYFGDSGTSYVGAGYSHGISREEPRGAGDLINVNADTVRGDFDIDMNERARWSVSASTSRQERAARTPLWQTTLSGGLTLRF
jgi:YaiO family outer membrane protein